MTRAGADPQDDLVIAGRALSDVLPPLRTRIVERVVRDIAESVDGYAHLPVDLLEVDVRAIARENLLAFEASTRGRSFPAQAVEAIFASAYRRAEEGLPLELVQEAYFAGTRVTWESVVGLAGAEDLDTVRALGHEMLRFLASVLPVVTSAYVEELRTREAETREARESILAALASGQDVERVAAAHGVSLADSYLVLAVGFKATTPTGDLRTSRVVARRTLRGIEAEIGNDRLSGVLFELDAFGGLVLLPRSREGAQDWTIEMVEELVDRISRRGLDVWVGYCESRLPGIPGAVAVGRDILDVVARGARPPGVYSLEDVLVDFQLTRPGPAADRVGEKMAAIADRSDLVETLRAYLANDRNRSLAAAAVNVHPNTVDYRLRRIEALVGLNPATVDGAALLRMGLLTVRDR